VVTYPWRDGGQAELIAQAALRLTDQASPRLLERAVNRIRDADGPPPAWITDDQLKASRRGRGPVRLISVSGTNGKSTTTRMITHIVREARLHAGTTTTDGVLIDERMVEPGDFTGPQGARAVLTHPEVDVAVLETARGGILLRGLGYESNDASVLTNISADHLDLQGVHTLPELAEVKSVICRVTRPQGTVVLNADDPLLVPVARRVRAVVTFFSLNPRNARIRSHVVRGGTAFVLDDGWIVELRGDRRRRVVAVAELPATLGGLARHNVANALAAAAGARAIRMPYRAIANGLRGFRNTADLMPGRLNLYRKDDRLVVVDYAHNEAGLAALLDTIEGLVGRRGRRRATVSVIIGAAGDRPDDAMRAVGRLAARRADEVAIKEDLPFLRGRTRASAIGELGDGIRAGGMNPATVPVYELELDGLIGELTVPGRLGATQDGTPRVVMLMCHAERDAVAGYLAAEGFDEVQDIGTLEAFRPRPR